MNTFSNSRQISLLIILSGSIILSGCLLKDNPADPGDADHPPSGQVLWETSPVQRPAGQTSMHATLDGGCVISFSSGVDIRLIRITPEGAILWNRTYSDPEFQATYESDGRETPDGGFIVSGYGQRLANEWGDCFFRTDADGEVIWRRRSISAEPRNAASIIPGLDGAFYLRSSIRDAGSGRSQACLIRLDQNGDLSWERRYTITGYDMSMRLWEVPYAGFAMSVESDAIFHTLLRLDANGDLIWQRRVNNDSGTYLDIHDVDAAGGYLLGGMTYVEYTGISTARVQKIDGAGLITWQYEGETNTHVQSSCVHPDGGAGIITYAEDTASWDVIRVDYGGLVMWNYEIAGALHSPSIVAAADGGLLIASLRGGESGSGILFVTKLAGG